MMDEIDDFEYRSIPPLRRRTMMLVQPDAIANARRAEREMCAALAEACAAHYLEIAEIIRGSIRGHSDHGSSEVSTPWAPPGQKEDPR